ncbi:intraflagellar transport-associated protein isoform X3 [Dermochelys coriacea]|uniref:intraflagellar transport-associated protein isoform X3 n=1 Tax=Dermochelys coriacea TaxID=27794 RepID=UPI0018E7E065|nr:intraflagellar transport-associated protein isoform X3 [Dermochelys coriacea]XP_043371992.1 intraflagellar transport-associated protein isoform X3 [Dermochelys coriacea]XP_043371993.1 intraflagellar transport-associated protein isoform X3 [Dermochelys coriacea]XP_043371995.1 intraflagellar transport-associated protein isoform X3 [Dermochelys coriacea]XP_043371996.1 intraflagellar transport-associated protein isoform X3 [Dermochelys coriacea]
MMEKQPSNSILDQFINSQEQTYEEFLSMFTYLWKEEVKIKSQVSEMDSIENTFSMPELSNQNKQTVSPIRNKEPSVSLSSQILDEDQIMMGEGWKVGCCNQGDLSLTRRVKVDNYLDLEDFDTDDEFGQGTYSGSLVLPGEVEQTATYYTPFFDQPTNREFGTLSITQPSISKTQELCGDEVQLFSLDEEFDYDSVALTPKFSEAEMKAIINLSVQKKVRLGLKSPGCED